MIVNPNYQVGRKNFEVEFGEDLLDITFVYDWIDVDDCWDEAQFESATWNGKPVDEAWLTKKLTEAQWSELWATENGVPYEDND